MDALDEMTLRKRRDRLYNPITATRVHLEMAMFQYTPPPPVPPPYMFNTPPVYDGAAYVPPQPPPPPDLTGGKRERPDPRYHDRNLVPDDVRARPNPPQGVKRERPDPRYHDRNIVQDETKQRVD